MQVAMDNSVMLDDGYSSIADSFLVPARVLVASAMFADKKSSRDLLRSTDITVEDSAASGERDVTLSIRVFSTDTHICHEITYHYSVKYFNRLTNPVRIHIDVDGLVHNGIIAKTPKADDYVGFVVSGETFTVTAVHGSKVDATETEQTGDRSAYINIDGIFEKQITPRGVLAGIDAKYLKAISDAAMLLDKGRCKAPSTVNANTSVCPFRFNGESINRYTWRAAVMPLYKDNANAND